MAGGQRSDAETSTVAVPGADAMGEELALARLQSQLFGRTSLPPSVGRYRIVESVGSGGFGVVYRGEDPELKRTVAIKVIGPGVGGARKDEHQQRLLREARAIAAVTHPNVIEVFDVGTVETEGGGGVFIAMEFVEGGDLRDWLQRGPHPWREVLRIFADAGEGLAQAHEADLTHRDFKPSNVLLGRDGRPRVVDFGLARSGSQDMSDGRVEHTASFDESRDEPPSPQDEASDSSFTVAGNRLTRTGIVIGTPAYMAPEQLELTAGPAADQFSFCVSLCEALYGCRPRWCDDPHRVRRSERSAFEDLPADTKKPRVLRPVLHRGLSFDPRQRYPSMRALLDDIHRRLRNRRLGWIAGGVVGVVAVGVVAAPRPEPRCEGAGAETGWDEARRDALVERLRDAGVSGARDVGARLDAYAEAWTRTYAEVCRGPVGSSQAQLRFDRTMTCLAARRRELNATIEVLRQSGAGARALEAVATLQPLSVCGEDAGPLGPTPSGEDAVAVELVRARIARAEAREWLGDLEGAREDAEGALASAREIGFKSAEAEALVRIGAVRAAVSDHKSAETHYSEAFALATEHGADGVALEAALGMVVIVAGYQLDVERGERWRRNLHALLDRGIGDTTQRARSAYVEGLVLLKQGDRKGGQALVQRAVDLQRSVVDGEPFALSHFEVGLASLKIRDEPAAAAEELLAAAEGIESLLGPHDARLSLPLAKRAVALRKIGRLEEGFATARRALRIIEDQMPDEVRQKSSLHVTLGLLHFDTGEFDQASQEFDHALAQAPEVGGARIRALAHFGRARVAVRRRDCHQARADFAAAKEGIVHEDAISPAEVDAARGEVESCRS